MANIDTRELSSHTTIPEAVFRRPAPGSSVAHQRAVGEINRRDAADTIPTSATESLTVPMHKILSLDLLKVTIAQNIDADKSTGVIIRNPEQIHRLDQANAAVELAHLVLERGYVDLTVGQKRQLQERVLPALMRLWPEFNTAFATLTRRDRQLMMDDFLADPQFSRELLTIIKELQSESNAVVVPDKSDFETKKETYDKKRIELTKLTGDYTQALSDKEAFDPHHPKADELALLPTASILDINLIVKNTELKALQNEGISLKEKIDIYFRALNDPRTTPELIRTKAEASDATHGIDALRRIKTELDTLLLPAKQSEIMALDMAKARRKELEEEQKEARKQEREILGRRDDLDQEVAKLNRERLSAQADVSLGKLKRTADEKVYVLSYQNSFARAAEVVVRDRITRKEDARSKLLAEIPDQAMQGVGKRWLSVEGELVKDRIKADYRRMIDGHMDEVTRDMLMAQGGMQGSEVDHKLLTDKAFADKARTDTATELMTRFIQSGGKMAQSDVRRLMNSEVGIDMVTEAVARNQTLNEKFEELSKNGAMLSVKEAKPGVNRKDQIKKILKKLPKPTRKQLLVAGLLAAGGYFAGPAILSALIPQIDKAAVKWSAVAAKHQVVQSVADVLSAPVVKLS